ncbi:oligosaccharide MFS transporter [Thalassotalea agariperforans]
MNNSNNTKYWLLSCALFSFFLTWSFGFSLFPIWLNQTIGLTGEQTGIIFSISALAALAVMPCYGFIQDKLGLGKGLLITVGALLFLSGPFFIFIYGPLLISHFYLGAILGAIFFSAAFSAGVGAVETYVERVSRAANFEYGRARMWGSLGWATATFFAGFLFNIDPEYNFMLASASACIFLLSIALLNSDELASNQANNDNASASKVNLRDAVKILTLKEFWGFATFIMGVSCVYGVYDQQFPIYFSSLFPTKDEGNAMYGYLNSFQVFLEAGGMFVAPFIVNKIGAKNGLLLSGVIMAMRIIGSGYADDTITISIMKLLHAAELPIMLVAIFKYISITFDNKYSATIYIVGFQFMSQVVASGLSVVVGAMYDAIGFPETYKILGAIVSAFVVISYFTLGKKTTKAPLYQPSV